MLKTPLARKVAVAVLIKVLALTTLWFVLIRPKFVHESPASALPSAVGEHR